MFDSIDIDVSHSTVCWSNVLCASVGKEHSASEINYVHTNTLALSSLAWINVQTIPCTGSLARSLIPIHYILLDSTTHTHMTDSNHCAHQYTLEYSDAKINSLDSFLCFWCCTVSHYLSSCLYSCPMSIFATDVLSFFCFGCCCCCCWWCSMCEYVCAFTNLSNTEHIA